MQENVSGGTRREEWSTTGVLLAPVLRTRFVGVMVFDEHGLCAAANDMSSAINGTLLQAGEGAREFVGKTLAEILGRQEPALEALVESVRETRTAMRDLEINSPAIPGAEAALQWRVDIFPASNAIEFAEWIGIAFTEVTIANQLKHRLRSLRGPSAGASEKDLDLPDGAARALAARLDEVCQKSVKVLQHSFSVRRRISQTRVATSLMRSALQTVLERSREDPDQHAAAAAPAESAGPPVVAAVDEGPANERPSRRERDVLRLLAEGKSSKQIAAVLNLSTRTVETYRARIMLKLNMHSLAEIVRYAIRTGIAPA